LIVNVQQVIAIIKYFLSFVFKIVVYTYNKGHSN